VPAQQAGSQQLHGADRRRAVLLVFRDERGRWCANSNGGMTGGTFFTREAALRFVQRETTALVLHIAPEISDLTNPRVLPGPLAP
jgi:hypothetical protein